MNKSEVRYNYDPYQDAIFDTWGNGYFYTKVEEIEEDFDFLKEITLQQFLEMRGFPLGDKIKINDEYEDDYTTLMSVYIKEGKIKISIFTVRSERTVYIIPRERNVAKTG